MFKPPFYARVAGISRAGVAACTTLPRPVPFAAQSAASACRRSGPRCKLEGPERQARIARVVDDVECLPLRNLSMFLYGNAAMNRSGGMASIEWRKKNFMY